MIEHRRFPVPESATVHELRILADDCREAAERLQCRSYLTMRPQARGVRCAGTAGHMDPHYAWAEANHPDTAQGQDVRVAWVTLQKEKP